jgi:photosystem II stability/assembly factor-like uncharacterized protein
MRPASLLLLAAALLSASAVSAQGPSAPATFDSAVVSGLGARNLGPAIMSGRVSAVAGRQEKDGKVTLFVGAASGGVWKSTDGGTTFKPVFDKQGVQSIGAVALDPSNPNVVWVGTGEAWTRNSVSIGDGVYKSTDGGETWAHMGLPESERIVKILVDPRNGNTVYVCAPGKLWSDSADRGLYKSVDGGKSWSLILKGSNLSTGCSGVTIDPRNPDRLFAGLWDFRRKGWTFRSGGEGPDAPSGSGLFASADGGRTWRALTADNAKGLPKTPWGRVEVEIAPSNPQIVYAFIEGVRSALFRSADGGRTWEERDRSQSMVWRPFYFANLVVDPTNADRVFKPNLNLIVSEDGGKSFATVGGSIGSTHGDHHDLWINPTNPKHIVTGDDGGLFISYDGGNKWWKTNNLPIAQFYHVSADDRDPYKVYGGLQDNTSWMGDSAYPGGVTNNRWESMIGCDGFWTFSDPADPDYVYAECQGGFVFRVNRHTLAARLIQPMAGYKEKMRYNWNTPIHLSPNDKKTVYLGSQFLFRSRDGGQNWRRISPDLTTNDPERQQQEKSGGITVDNSAAEMHTTIYTISESPKNGKQIWVGTDDGNIQLTRDGGRNWTNLSANLAAHSGERWISWVEASPHDAATAFVAVDRHTFGDMNPYAYRTSDYGQTWTPIVGPQSGVRGYAHVVRQDPVVPGLLYLGTELGLWISIDGGANWAEFKGGDFPAVAVRDVYVQARDRDLVIGTHGRGIWIIDDLTPLRALTPETLGQEFAFLEARPVQQRSQGNGGWVEGDATYVGPNPPDGAAIAYYQRGRHVFGRMKIDVLDKDGQVVDTIPAGKRKGVNRVMWSMREKPPRVPTAASAAFFSGQGPRVLPGTYTVRVTKAGKTYERTIEVGLDRRATFSVADRKAQHEAALRASALFGRMSDLVDKLNGLKVAAGQRANNADEALKADISGFVDKVETVRKEIVATTEGGAITGEERLREHLDNAYGAIASYEGRPGPYQVERVAVLEREFSEVETKAQAVFDTDLAALNEKLKAKGLEPITVAEAAEEGARFAAADSVGRVLRGEAIATRERD